MKNLITAVIALLAALPTIASAQTLSGEGERVRITRTDGSVVIGSLARAFDGEVRVMDGKNGREYLIPVSEVGSLHQSMGHRQRFGRNFAIGLVSTSALTGALAAATWSSCSGWLCVGPESRGEALVWGLAGGAVIGVPVGLVVGNIIREERWVPAPLSDMGGAQIQVRPIVGRQTGIYATVPIGAR